LTFVLLASLVVSFLASSSAPTPIYALYQQHWGLTPITVTIVFGAYALAVLVSLLTLGKLSDHVGRKPVLAAALIGQIIAMIVFTSADGLPALLAARVVQGVATGAAFGAIGASMIDIDAPAGTLANAVSPGLGTATGAIVSAVVVQFLPAPTHLIYDALLVCYLLQLAAVVRITETVSRAPGALASMVPEFALPPAVRRAALTAAPVLFSVWSLAGFYGSLGPTLIRALTHSSSAVIGALPLFVLAAAGTMAIVALRNLTPTAMFGVGVAALITGLAVTLACAQAGSAVGFLIGSAIAGAGFGSGFQGGIRTVMPLAAAHQRSGVLSVLYSVCYVGFGGPAVIGGILLAHQGKPVTVAMEYGITLAVLAALACLGLRRPNPGKGA
jgi:MFS family permease